MTDPFLQRLDEKLDQIDARADERHEKLITRITTIETLHSQTANILEKTKKQCDEHERVKNVAYGAMFVNLGALGLWLKSHIGLK